MAAKSLQQCKGFGCRTMTLNEYCSQCLMKSNRRKPAVEPPPKRIGTILDETTKPPETGYPPIQRPLPPPPAPPPIPPASDIEPVKKGRLPWTPEQREKYRKTMEAKKMKPQEPVLASEPEVIDIPAPKTTPSVPANGPRPLIDTRRVNVMRPFEISFEVGRDPASWLVFTAAWETGYADYDIYSSYENRDDKAKFIVNLRPRG